MLDLAAIEKQVNAELAEDIRHRVKVFIKDFKLKLEKIERNKNSHITSAEKTKAMIQRTYDETISLLKDAKDGHAVDMLLTEASRVFQNY